MSQPKVLVACPIIDRNKYCIDKFLDCVNSLTYTNKEFLLVDNSATEDFYNELKTKGLNVIRGKHFDKAIPALVFNRNIIRSYFLARDFDYLFSLDSDVICQPDSIEKLMKHEKEIVTGIYYSAKIEQGKMVAKPMLFNRLNDEEFKQLLDKGEYKKQFEQGMKREEIFKQLTRDDVKEPKLMETAVAGLGVVLIKRNILEKIAFRFDPDINATDDFFFFVDTEKAGFKLYADTTVKCSHLHGGRKN